MLGTFSEYLQSFVVTSSGGRIVAVWRVEEMRRRMLVTCTTWPAASQVSHIWRSPGLGWVRLLVSLKMNNWLHYRDTATTRLLAGLPGLG